MTIELFIIYFFYFSRHTLLETALEEAKEDVESEFEDASEDFEEDEVFVDAREEPEEERGVKRKREVVTILFLVLKALVHVV